MILTEIDHVAIAVHDLEAAIDRLLGYPEKTPSGELIPSISRTIEPIAASMLSLIHI